MAVEAVGLCASDLAQLHGHKHVPGETSPVVPGHEIVGRVQALAEGAQFGVEVGQRVAVDMVRRCGECASCHRGSLSCDEMQLYGYTQGLEVRSGLHGGYAELMEVLPGTNLLPLTEDVPAEELSLFEPLADVINWTEGLHVQAGETVVIQGPGHLGLICAAYVHLMGAGPVIVTGRARDTFRLDAALTVGADHIINVDEENVVEGVRDRLDGRLADVAIDLTDAPAAVGLCLELAGMGGRVLWAGLKSFSEVSIVSDLVPLKRLTLVGGAGSTAASCRQAAELLNSRRFPTEALRGEVFTLDRLDEAMALLARSVPDADAVRVSLSHDRNVQ